MKIVQILHEYPEPRTSGVRCDMARRLDAFLDLGHEVFAITWVPGGTTPPTPADQAAFGARLAGFELMPIGSDPASRLRRLWNMRRHPSYIAARIPPADRTRELVARVRAFAPDMIWLEGVHPSWLALELSRLLGVPLFYRCHNIEFRYVAEQAQLASGLRQKLALHAGAWGLERAELALHAQAAHVFDISSDDLRYWRDRGYANNSWLAPLADPRIVATSDKRPAARDIDLLYLGGLSSPNNQAGLRWYLEHVHPAVVAAIGDVRVTVAGRKPPASLSDALAAAGIAVIADPPDATALFRRARALFNPILHGSGVNIKTIDMLATGLPLAMTPLGVRGLPPEVADAAQVGGEPAEFAQAVIQAVHAGRSGIAAPGREAMMQRFFGQRAVAEALDVATGGREAR